MNKKQLFLVFLLSCFILISNISFIRATNGGSTTIMGEYCNTPAFITQSVPPLIMFVMERDHKLFYEAYNDSSDLDGDGRLDVGYKHSIDYYGYFDPYKCYTYQGSGSNAMFVPVRKTSNKYCGGAGEWSGNFLNWLAMSRMDVIKKVLYGGTRLIDSASETVLEGTFIPRDAHSWGKEYSASDTNLLTPFSAPQSGRRHLFAVTSYNDGETPRIRVLLNRTERIWQWVSIERPVCQNSIDSNNNGRARFSVTDPDTQDPDLKNDIKDYFIRVKVCDPSVGLEPNCRMYPAGTYKPVGLLQKYGEGTGSKVCSKSFKACNSDADCGTGEGLCIDNGRMFFGLATGSYTKNVSGGVLRKNIWSITDETNPNTGIFQASENVEGNIVRTIDRMKIIGFKYSPDFAYLDSQGGSCGWITTRGLQEGECRSWGNPIGEILYETLRYFAGKGNPTSDYDYSGSLDSGLDLSKPDWGIEKGNQTFQPLDLFPWCSKPFIIILSDIYPSYDSDKVPGSNFEGFTGDLLGLNVSSLSNFISSEEGISGSKFIGQSGNIYDFLCSPKPISNLSSVRGLCPEEPTKQGSFYSPAVAYYGNILMKDFIPQMRSGVSTYAVVTPSPVPDIKIKIGNNYVRIVPTGKSVSGCLSVYNSCAASCSLTRDSNGLHISNCGNNSYCPSNTIVDFYVLNINYDAQGNVTYAKFRINFEDVEQGADHDMDAIVEYEIQPVGSNQVQVKLTSVYAAGCIDQVLGFVISGTTEDGVYLPVKDKDVEGPDGDTPPEVAGLGTTWTKTFTVSGTTAEVLKDPLWYAAKWGGFTDMDGSRTPNLPQEWDKDNDGNPDTYYFVSNPLELEKKLESAILDILKRASSGTAASVLSTSTRGAVSMLQAFFTPKYVTVDKELTWTGHLQYLWLDPKFNVREDTEKDDKLILNHDRIIQPYIDPSTNDVKVRFFEDNNADGKPDSPCFPNSIGSFEEISPIWRAEAKLLVRDPNDRKIYTFLDTNKNGRPDSNEFIEFKTSEAVRLAPYFRVSSSEAEKYIRYIRGEDIDICLDPPTCSTFGHRDRTIAGKVWKLGDIVHSTPRIVGNNPINTYHIDYMDTTYQEFVKSADPNNPTLYERRENVVYFGANDGMLHCVNMGKLKEDKDPNNPAQKAHLEGEGRGEELWAYIPYNLIPQTPWIGYPDYCHIYYVDGRTLVFDASINGPSAGTKTKDSWRTILIGTMRLGGKPISITGDFGLGNETRTFRSAIFAMDVTDPRNPSLLWEFTDPDLGFTTSFPTVVRFGDKSVNGDWYLVFGNGPENFSGRNQTKSPKLYVVDLRTGTLLRKIEISSNIKGYLGDVIAIDPDKDYQVDTIYAGTVEMSNNPPLVGRLLRIQTMESPDPNSWVVSTLVNPQRPITASPEVVFDERRNIWVLFGTGIFLSVDDKTLTTPQSLFGVKDENWRTGTGTVDLNQLFTMDLSDNSTANDYDVTAEIEDFTCYCNGVEVPEMIQRDANGKKIGCLSPAEKVVTYVKDAKVGTTNWKEHLNTVTTQYKGWRLIIPSGERCITKPFVIAGLADFLVYKPTDDPCSMGGETKMYTLYYQTGTAFLQPIYLTPSAVSGSKIERAISLGPGAPPPGEGVSAAITKEGNIEKFVQVSTGIVIQGLQQPPYNIKSRIVHWMEK